MSLHIPDFFLTGGVCLIFCLSCRQLLPKLAVNLLLWMCLILGQWTKDEEVLILHYLQLEPQSKNILNLWRLSPQIARIFSRDRSSEEHARENELSQRNTGPNVYCCCSMCPTANHT